MGTSLQTIYDKFLAKMLDDEWVNWEQEQVDADLRELLLAALPWFKFPRQSLEIVGDNFVSDLTNEEIQIIATYMKCEWLNRTILTWENVKPLYEERDFSQANLIDKFNELLTNEKNNAKRLESFYYRSISYAPFDYTKMAGSHGQ